MLSYKVLIIVFFDKKVNNKYQCSCLTSFDEVLMSLMFLYEINQPRMMSFEHQEYFLEKIFLYLNLIAYEQFFNYFRYYFSNNKYFS